MTKWTSKGEANAHLLVIVETPNGGSDAVIVSIEALRTNAVAQPGGSTIADRLAIREAMTGHKVITLTELSGELISQGSSWDKIGVDWFGVVESIGAASGNGRLHAMRVKDLDQMTTILLSTHSGQTVAPGQGMSSQQLNDARDKLRSEIENDLAESTKGDGLTP